MSTSAPTEPTAAPATDAVEQVLELAKTLTRQDKLRLIVELAQQLQDAPPPLPAPAKKPFRSIYGIAAHLGPGPSAEDIDEMRREAWANFPREEFYE